MKIVSINGRLETQGTWEETDAQAKRQAAGIVQQRTELRAMLSGNVAFHVDPRAAKPVKRVKRVRLCLTDEAEAEYASFYREYGGGNCSCHISAPCGSCTHPGNPSNQAEDDTAWVTCVDPARDGSDCTVWTVGQGQTHTVVGGPVRMHNLPKAKAAVKPPAVWRTADQIPQSERQGLWFYEDGCGIPGTAGQCLFDGPGEYLKAPEGARTGDFYDFDAYQQSDANGWFAHDPQPDSVCPVPAGVKFVWRGRDGNIRRENCRHEVWWRVGVTGNSDEMGSDIVAWSPVGVAA
jgi:hypothetical protein